MSALRVIVAAFATFSADATLPADPAPLIEAGRRIYELSARLEIIEHCGHLSTIEQPETVNRVLVSWLGESDGYSAARKIW